MSRVPSTVLCECTQSTHSGCALVVVAHNRPCILGLFGWKQAPCSRHGPLSPHTGAPALTSHWRTPSMLTTVLTGPCTPTLCVEALSVHLDTAHAGRRSRWYCRKCSMTVMRTAASSASSLSDGVRKAGCPRRPLPMKLCCWLLEGAPPARRRARGLHTSVDIYVQMHVHTKHATSCQAACLPASDWLELMRPF